MIKVKPAHLGIIGGVGPLPTMNFYVDVLEKYRLSQQGQYPEFSICSIPVSAKIESEMISGATHGKEVDDVCEQISSAYRKLNHSSVDTYVIICNTLTHYAKQQLDFPFINPVDATVETIKRWNIKKVALLATTATIRLGGYQKALKKLNVECICPEGEDQQLVVNYIIDQLQSENKTRHEAQVMELTKRLANQADAIILGCTDLFRLGEKAIEENIPVLNSQRILIDHALSKALQSDDDGVGQNEPESKSNSTLSWINLMDVNTEKEYFKQPNNYLENQTLPTIISWLENFISKPDPRLNRSGAVCPFVPNAMREKDIFLYAYGDKNISKNKLIEHLINASYDFTSLPTGSSNKSPFKSFILLFPELEEKHHKLLKEAVAMVKPILLSNGVTVGEFYPSNPDGCVHNPAFKIAQSPYPMFVIRSLAAHDKLFLSSKPELMELYERTHKKNQ